LILNLRLSPASTISLLAVGDAVYLKDFLMRDRMVFASAGLRVSPPAGVPLVYP